MALWPWAGVALRPPTVMIVNEIDRSSYEPHYLQLARILRMAIEQGRFGPGEKLPSETRLIQQYETGRDTVRDALKELRTGGVITTVKGSGSFVRGQGDMREVRLDEGARVTSRMPTADERRSLDIPEGVPIFVVSIGDTVQIHPADRTVLLAPGE